MLTSRFGLPACLALLTFAGVSAASAADFLPPPPPPEPCCSGWYLRGDLGFSSQNVGSLYSNTYATNFYNIGGSVINVDKGFDAAPFFGLGIGYAFNNWLRFDVTGEYRGNANFHGMDIGVVGTSYFPDNYSGSKSEWTFLANGYVDLGTWYCITPFVGAGVGVSRNTISNFTDIGVNVAADTYFDTASKWSFAWALYGGLAYKVSPNVTVELAYRYLDLGDATTGTGHAYDGSSTWAPFEFNHLTSSDIKLGVRFTCCELPPPPPPLQSRG